MFQHVLIPTDGSPLSAAAAEKAMAFARDAGARVTMLSVVEPYPGITGDSVERAEARAQFQQMAREHTADSLSYAAQKARALGIACQTVQAENGDPWRVIVETATAKGCDLIAMASHGRRGLAALLLGSQTTKVLTHSKIPVLVYR
ncbi:universal stress protein [Rhodoligotrophos ferricapiens]|uniref:universal stress protein n=1 Tax=Rhodoligotrophos ferricapiens TaxID=3069264 RepID=UPI00315DEE6F